MLHPGLTACGSWSQRSRFSGVLRQRVGADAAAAAEVREVGAERALERRAPDGVAAAAGDAADQLPAGDGLGAGGLAAPAAPGA